MKKIFEKKALVWTGCILAVIALLAVGFHAIVTKKVSFGADFYTFWQAGRAVFVNGENPYNQKITDLIQQGIYGRPALPGEDQVGFAYPPFTLLWILPSVWMNYAWAQAFWMAFNLVLVFAAVFYFMRKPKWWVILGLIFFYPISRSIILGQFSLLAGSLALIAFGYQDHTEPTDGKRSFINGVLLSLLLIKPQLVWGILLFSFILIIRGKNWKLAIGFISGLIVQLLISWALVPSWINNWILAVRRYSGYVPNHPLIQDYMKLVGIDWTLTAAKVVFAACALLFTFCFFYAYAKKGLTEFIFFGWFIVLTVLLDMNPNSQLSDLIIVLLPIIIWFKQSRVNWQRMVSWACFITIPWVLFIVFFQGKEPHQVSIGLSAVFITWWLLMLANYLHMRLNIHLEEIKLDYLE